MNTLILIFLLLALIFFFSKLFNRTPRFDYLAAGFICLTIAFLIPVVRIALRGAAVIALLAVVCLSGCTNGQAWTPEQAQAYANAGHTLVHGALIDAKDASSVYRNIEQP